jgi:uncharacterized membrane protein (UPF0127 family)
VSNLGVMPSLRPRRLAPYVVGVLVAALAAFGLSRGANLPADPTFAPEPSTSRGTEGGAEVTPTSVASVLDVERVAAVRRAWKPTSKPKRATVKPFASVAFEVQHPVGCGPSRCRWPARATRGLVVRAAATVLQWCALLADIEPERQVGLMGRTDLADHDGMIFQFERDSSEPFFMFQTIMPLSIAWFDEDGEFVSSADMEPCTETNPRKCPLYPAGRPYRYAIEVPTGGLEAIGVGPGTVLALGSTCRK